jgi:hydrogenase/urease accessory protein HupE
MADFIIFEISVIGIILLTVILNITIVTDNWLSIFLCMSVFGLPFITLSYAIGYIIKNPETGYKFAILFGMATYGLPRVIQVFATELETAFGVIVPWISLSNSL